MDLPKRISTKTRILQSAVDEFIDKGSAGFTVYGVANRTGISVGNLTYHYPARQGLVEAMISCWIQRWNAEFDQLLASTAPL